MADRTRGLPPSYNLNVPKSVTQGPVQLGDYLEEEDIAPGVPAARQVAAPLSTTPPMPGGAPAPPPAPTRRPVPGPRRLATSVPRKQVNMSPETLRMVDELLDYIRTYSVQKDVKASELFHGLVLALYEAREHLDFSYVQPRGRWGTPTAAAFPIALKNAFQAAILNWQGFNQP